MAQRKDKARREKKKEREIMTLEMKVRALKLFLVDKLEPVDILTDLETSCGLRIKASDWNNAEQFLKRIEQSIQQLIQKEGRHTQNLLKLLTQAQLINNKEIVK